MVKLFSPGPSLDNVRRKELFDEIEARRQALLLEYKGAVTLCYPYGLNCAYMRSHRPFDSVVAIAEAIGEPVQLAVNLAVDLEQIVWMFRPVAQGSKRRKPEARAHENPSALSKGWLPPVALSTGMTPAPLRLAHELRHLSGHQRDPRYCIDFGSNTDITGNEVWQRVMALAHKTGFEVYGRHRRAVFREIGPQTVLGEVPHPPAVGRSATPNACLDLLETRDRRMRLES